MARKADRDASETKQSILDAAVAVLRANSPDGLRVSDVAVAANVGTPTIYYHFKSREHLITCARDTMLRRILEPQIESLRALHDELRRAVDAKDRDAFWIALEKCIIVIWESEQSGGAWSTILLTGFYQQVNGTEIDGDVLQIRAAVASLIVERTAILADAQKCGLIRADASVAILNLPFFIARLAQLIPLASGEFSFTPSEALELTRYVLDVR